MTNLLDYIKLNELTLTDKAEHTRTMTLQGDIHLKEDQCTNFCKEYYELLKKYNLEEMTTERKLANMKKGNGEPTCQMENTEWDFALQKATNLQNLNDYYNSVNGVSCNARSWVGRLKMLVRNLVYKKNSIEHLNKAYNPCQNYQALEMKTLDTSSNNK
jgi:hypothetical protein